MQGIIIKPDSEKGIECYASFNLAVIWNQDKGTGPILVLSIMGFTIIYINCSIIWSIQLQTYISLIPTEV